MPSSTGTMNDETRIIERNPNKLRLQESNPILTTPRKNSSVSRGSYCSTPTVPTSTTSDRRRATVSEGRPTTKITSNSSNNGLPLTKLKEKDEISQLPPPKSKST
ncbi:unnamed protein product, partial [Didymodactylos carnosus]